MKRIVFLILFLACFVKAQEKEFYYYYSNSIGVLGFNVSSITDSSAFLTAKISGTDTAKFYYGIASYTDSVSAVSPFTLQLNSLSANTTYKAKVAAVIKGKIKQRELQFTTLAHSSFIYLVSADGKYLKSADNKLLVTAK